MQIYIKYTIMINLKTLFEKYKRIVQANSTRTLEGQKDVIFTKNEKSQNYEL